MPPRDTKPPRVGMEQNLGAPSPWLRGSRVHLVYLNLSCISRSVPGCSKHTLKMFSLKLHTSYQQNMKHMVV